MSSSLPLATSNTSWSITLHCYCYYCCAAGSTAFATATATARTCRSCMAWKMRKHNTIGTSVAAARRRYVYHGMRSFVRSLARSSWGRPGRRVRICWWRCHFWHSSVQTSLLRSYQCKHTQICLCIRCCCCTLHVLVLRRFDTTTKRCLLTVAGLVTPMYPN